jgi:UDP-N-acetylglucosamine/UDP-N-acetylgalactosamine 4-epimerase
MKNFSRLILLLTTYYLLPKNMSDLQNKAILITGGAGFIGSNIAEYLLQNGARRVRVLDNLQTGFLKNISPFLAQYPNFDFIEGDITDLDTCRRACEGMDIICHQAALGSVPRSIKEPQATVRANIDGFVNMVVAAKEAGIGRFVYASSSSVYGDEPNLPKVEHRIGKPLSPYAISKWSNEVFAQNFATLYQIDFVGFRYFNVFGRRQSPEGAYAAVIPIWVEAALTGQPAYINGQGQQTRDFTYIDNVVQINVKAMLSQRAEALNQVYNVGCGGRYSLLQLHEAIRVAAGSDLAPIFREPRAGDVQDSQANIDKARQLLDYQPLFDFEQGLAATVADMQKILAHNK